MRYGDCGRDVGRAFDLLVAERLWAETGHQVASPDQLSAAVKFLRAHLEQAWPDASRTRIVAVRRDLDLVEEAPSDHPQVL